MDLRNTYLTPESNDPAEYTQSRCSIGPGIEKSPCLSCHHYVSGKPPCRDNEDCLLGCVNNYDIEYESKETIYKITDKPPNSVRNNRRIKFKERYGFYPCEEYLDFPSLNKTWKHPLVEQFKEFYGKEPWPHENQTGFKNNTKRKLTDEQVRLIRKNSKLPKNKRVLIKDLAKEFGITPQCLTLVISGKSYSHVK